MLASIQAANGPPSMGDRTPPAHPIDLALAAAAGAGDAMASERLVRRALPLVRKVARTLIADPTEAEDALQLALIEVLGAARTYRGTGALDPWIRTVAARCVLRYARKARSSRLHGLPSPGLVAPSPMGPTAVRESLPRPLEHYLAALPEAQREALVLRHALGHTIAEIGALTGAPEPTVISRINKARQELRRLIQRDINLGTGPVARTS